MPNTSHLDTCYCQTCLSVVLIVDIRLRSTSSNAAEHHDVGGIISGTTYDVDDPPVSPPRRRYHGTQFISFTIHPGRSSGTWRVRWQER